MSGLRIVSSMFLALLLVVAMPWKSGVPFWHLSLSWAVICLNFLWLGDRSRP